MNKKGHTWSPLSPAPECSPPASPTLAETSKQFVDRVQSQSLLMRPRARMTPTPPPGPPPGPPLGSTRTSEVCGTDDRAPARRPQRRYCYDQKGHHHPQRSTSIPGQSSLPVSDCVKCGKSISPHPHQRDDSDCINWGMCDPLEDYQVALPGEGAINPEPLKESDPAVATNPQGIGVCRFPDEYTQCRHCQKYILGNYTSDDYMDHEYDCAQKKSKARAVGGMLGRAALKKGKSKRKITKKKKPKKTKRNTHSKKRSPKKRKSKTRRRR